MNELGHQCFQCRLIVSNTWNGICSQCRTKNEKHRQSLVSPSQGVDYWKRRADFYESMASIGSKVKEAELMRARSLADRLEKELHLLKKVQRKSLSFYIKWALRVRITLWFARTRAAKEMNSRLRDRYY